MKDPKIEKLIVEFKQTLEKLNQIHSQLEAESVWVDLGKETKGQGWQIKHLKQTVEY